MTIERGDAERALRDAQAAAERSATAIGHERAAPYLILWGGVWLAGNLALHVHAPSGALVFPLLMLAGVVGSVALGLRAPRRDNPRAAVHAGVIALAILLFGQGVAVVVPSNAFASTEAIICLGIGACYMVMGLFTGWRLSVVGAVLQLLVIAGMIYLREQFFLWLALAGGGGLILGGLWLRKA